MIRKSTETMSHIRGAFYPVSPRYCIDDATVSRHHPLSANGSPVPYLVFSPYTHHTNGPANVQFVPELRVIGV